MRYQIEHVTEYVYESPAAQCLSEAHLIPRETPGQKVIQSAITVDPEPVEAHNRIDYFGNRVDLFSILKSHERLTVVARSAVEVTPQPEPACSITWEEAAAVVSAARDDDALEALQYVFDSPYVTASPNLRAYGEATFTAGRPLQQAAVELCHRIYREFTYKPKSTSIDMPLEKVLQQKEGVCQDFAHIMIGVLRSYKLAARYVSGYLKSGATYQGAEASHAWVSVFLPGHGWLDLDPTNDVAPTNGHITVAWGRDYGDVTPVKGVTLGGGRQSIYVGVRAVPAP